MGKATWYALVRLYTAVTSLSELRSQGQQFYSINWSYPDPLQEGDTGDKIRHLQYMLSILSTFIPQIPNVAIDGIFGPKTRDAVLAAQRWFSLPETGLVDDNTWDEIYDQFSGIENISLRNRETFPYTAAEAARTPPRNRYSKTTTMTQFPGNNLRMGNQDPVRQEVVR